MWSWLKKKIKQLWGLWSFAERGWAILGWLGAGNFIISSAMSAWVYMLAVAEGLPHSVLVVLVISAFTMTLLGINTVNSMLRKPKPVTGPSERIHPHYDIWDGVNNFELWQVASLWVGEEPISRSLPNTKARAVRHMLVQDSENGVLEVDQDDDDPDFLMLNRATLIKYAKKKQMRPLFLFPEDR